jgi:hypothetical protein
MGFAAHIKSGKRWYWRMEGDMTGEQAKEETRLHALFMYTQEMHEACKPGKGGVQAQPSK